MSKEVTIEVGKKISEKEKKNLVLFIQGGAGDVIAHSPMIRSFRKEYPNDRIIVLSTYSQLFENNPNIDKLHSLSDHTDFYTQYMFEQPLRFYKKHFIYDHLLDEVSTGCTTLPEFICKAYGTEYDNGAPDYFISEEEDKIIDTFLKQFPPQSEKPIVLLHCTGSIPSDGAMNKVHGSKDLDIQTAAQVIQNFKDGVIFVQIGLQGEPLVPGAFDALGMPMREAIALIPRCSGFIFIESLFAHCAAAFNKPGVVVYQNTSPEFFTYPSFTAATKVHNSGKCPHWPCNRPLGALMDLQAGYTNPKTREKVLWECPTKLCKHISSDELSSSLHSILSVKDKK